MAAAISCLRPLTLSGSLPIRLATKPIIIIIIIIITSEY
jgi:hypothetical protein